MRRSRPRPPPRERGAVGAPSPPRPGPNDQGSSNPPQSDTIDLLAKPPNPIPAPWDHVWKRIQGSFTDRAHHALAWRVLHCSVFCGAFLGHIRRNLPDRDICCSRPCCAGQPETLTHMFLTCPVSARVIRWVCDIWPLLTGGLRPPASAAVFLGGDYRVWDPGTSHTELWTRLRLATLHAIWGAARQRRKGVVSLSSAIAVKIVFGLRRSMWRDWQRTQEDIRLHTSMLSDWLRGRDPCISVEQFQALWGPSGGLYSLIPPVLPLGRPTLQIRFSCTIPVRIPTGGEHW